MTAESIPARPAWRRWLPLFGLCLLGWVLSRLDLGALSRAFGRVSLATVALSCAWFTLNLWLKVCRWQRLLFAQGIRLPHRVALAAFMSAQFYAQVTVGRVGEFVRIEALTERGIGAGSALSSCIFDRLLDVFIVLCAGSVLGAFVLGAARAALLAALLMALLALLALWFVRRVGRDPSVGAQGVVARAIAGLERRPLGARGLGMLRELARGMLPMLRLSTLLEAMAWTVAAWACYLSALFALADGLRLSVSRLLLTAAAAFAALSALLPVTVSGLGARELIYIEALRAHGVAGESAVAMSLLHLIVMSACAIGLGLLGVVWRQRQRG